MSFIINHVVYDQVCERIFSRPNFIVGGVSAKPLAHDIGTSIVPVREALIRLAQQDALNKIPSKGFFIPPINATLVADSFNTARNLLVRHKPIVDLNDQEVIQASIATNSLFARHWNAFEGTSLHPLLDSSKKGQCTDFDRRFLYLVSKRMMESDFDIARYIWGKTVHFRYYIYNNFGLYAATEPEQSRFQTKDLLVSFISDVFDRYVKLAGSIANLRSAPQRPSPYM